MNTAIEIEKLSYSYPDGRQALYEVNLVVEPGETVAVIGSNGAGKSTLLMHLNGILRADAGKVLILGVAVEDRTLKWVRSKVGLIFQNPDDQLFCPTVFDDVAFGPMNMQLPDHEIRARVAQALEWVGMSGYESRSSHHLSIGEKKRIAIATILSMAPEILVIDEPTANLDPRGKWELISLINSLTMTTLVSSHDLETVAALCQRTVVLDAGRLVADGATTDILSDTTLLEQHGLARTRHTAAAM